MNRKTLACHESTPGMPSMSQPTLTGSGSINWVASPAPTSEVPVGELDLIVGVLSAEVPRTHQRPCAGRGV